MHLMKLAISMIPALLLVAPPADAALTKFRINSPTVANNSALQVNPDILDTENDGPAKQSVALVEQVGSSPRLHKFIRAVDQAFTTNVPALAINVFTSLASRQGPSVTQYIHGQSGTPVFTGTGATTAGSTIRWGIVTGWSVSGTNWCNSSPPVICTLSMFADEASTDPLLSSSFYDLGTWYFHGTGFTSYPFITDYATAQPGNTMAWPRGRVLRDSTVPVLGVAGVLVLAGSLIAGGGVALRRRREP